MDTLTILNPVSTVKVAGETVEVRELKWPDAVGFLQTTAKHVGKLLTPSGQLNIDPAQLPAVIAETGELAEFLILKATGKDVAWLNGLRATEALEVLDAALEQNLHPALFERGKAVAARLKGAFRGEGQGGSQPTNSMPKPPTS